jgi:hypothetical protein
VNAWERANIHAAASYLRERMAQGAIDAKTKAVYEGLLEVLDPTRRTTRVQRELASAAKAAVAAPVSRERRAAERRREDRRKANLGSPTGVERRNTERRSGRDRRNR